MLVRFVNREEVYIFTTNATYPLSKRNEDELAPQVFYKMFYNYMGNDTRCSLIRLTKTQTILADLST